MVNKLTIKNYIKLNDITKGNISILQYDNLYEVSCVIYGYTETFLLNRTPLRNRSGKNKYELHSKRRSESKWLSIHSINNLHKFIYIIKNYKDVWSEKSVAVGLKKGSRLW